MSSKNVQSKYSVAAVTQQSKQIHSLGPTSEYRERPKSTWFQTVRRADDQRWSVDGISVPSRRPEHNRQIDTEAQYRWGSDESRWWRSGTSIASGDCHASAASSLGQTSLYQLECGAAGCGIHHTLQFVGDDLWSPG